MSALRRDIPDLAIPVNIGLLVWMVAGRGLFVPLGWVMIFGVLASPILVIFLAISTTMMRRPRGRELTPGQARTQVILWSAMFGFGLTCVDGGDGGSFDSVLTKLTGGWPTMQTVSGVLCFGCCVVGLVAWVVLVSSLRTRMAAPLPPQLRPNLGTDPPH